MNLSALTAAIIAVESSGVLTAFNAAEQAHGPLQVRPCVIEDVNRMAGTAYTTSDCYDPQTAQRIQSIYTYRWLTIKGIPAGMSLEEAVARTWNGGPNGPRKEATAGYWNKVKEEMK